MGWWHKQEWKTTKEAITDEAKVDNTYEVLWHSGASYIYLRKADKCPCHSYYLTRKDKDGIWVKTISDIRSETAAKKFKPLVEAYIKANPNATDIEWYKRRIEECDFLIKKAKAKEQLNSLKVGDTAYVSDEWSISGICRIVETPNAKHHSFRCSFPGRMGLVRVCKEAFDLEKTFQKSEEQKADEQKSA